MTFPRSRFGAAVSVPPLWRGRFGAETFRRQDDSVLADSVHPFQRWQITKFLSFFTPGFLEATLSLYPPQDLLTGESSTNEGKFL